MVGWPGRQVFWWLLSGVLMRVPAPVWGHQSAPYPEMELGRIVIEGIDLNAFDLSSEEFQSIERSLLEMSKQPINLNAATRSILEQIPLLAASDVDALLAYRTSAGTITALSALDDIPGLSTNAALLLRLVSYVDKETHRSRGPKRSWMQARTLVKGRWDSNEGPPANGGSRFQRMLRIRGRMVEVSWALTLQNDPYELFRWKPSERWFGFDHISGYLQWSTRGSLLAVTIGSFTVDAGQGLVHARPFGTRLSASSPSRVVRTWSGIRGYAGSSSDSSLRGIGVSAGVSKNLRILGYISRKSLDARRDSSALAPGYHFVLSSSGTHVSAVQLSRRQVLSSSVYGGLMEWQMGHVQIGVQFSKSFFRHPVQKRAGDAVKSHFAAASLYAVADVSWFRIVGEITLDHGPARQYVFGATWKPSRSVRLFFHTYRYVPGIIYQFGRPYRLTRSLKSQEGITVGSTMRPSRDWALSASLSIAAGSGVKGLLYFPLISSDLRLHLRGKISRAGTMKFLLRSKQVQTSITTIHPSGSQIRGSGEERLWQSSFLLSYSVSPALTITSRIDTNRAYDLAYNEGHRSKSGIHVFQQVTLSSGHTFSVVLRHALFSAPESENRFYIYEADVRGQLSVPVLSEEGSRTSILLTYAPSPRWQFQVKWAGMIQESETAKTVAGTRVFAPRRVQLLSLQVAVEL